MKRWIRRFAYGSLLLAWLLLLLLPVLAFLLAARGELQIGADPRNNVRLFLVQDRDLGGVGLIRTHGASDDPFCVETSARYIMWRGSGESSRACQCYAAPGGGLSSTAPGPCPPLD